MPKPTDYGRNSNRLLTGAECWLIIQPFSVIGLLFNIFIERKPGLKIPVLSDEKGKWIFSD